MRKKLLWCLVAGLVAIVPTQLGHAAGGTIVDEGFIPAGTQDGTVGYQGVRLMERPDYTETASVLRYSPSGMTKVCTSISDSPCAPMKDVFFTAILQPCAAPTDLNCVVEFGVVGADGKKIAASFARKFPAEAWNKYPADSSVGLPEGGPGALWTVPEAAGLPVSLHYVRASVQGNFNSGGKAVFTDFAASLTPVQMGSMSCSGVTEWQVSGKDPCTSGFFQTTRDAPGSWGFVEGAGWGQKLDCEMSGNPDYAKSTAECALRKPALLTTKYYLNIRLAQSPQGWLHGRLADSDVSITPIDGVPGAVTIAVAAKPVRVPVVFKDAKFGTLPANLQDAYRASGGWPSTTGAGGASNWGPMDTDSKSPTGRNRLSIPPSYGPDGIAELAAWMPFLNDTATADRATWSLRTLRNWERSQANECIADTSKVTGLVLTNATQYLAGAPALNKASGALEYKVAAPHYMSSGEVFRGSYELIVRTDVARCIYKFSSAPIRATVDVVEEGGTTATASTSVSEANGWLKLTATGFTHSSPTVRATLTQEATTATTPAATPAVSTVPASTSTGTVAAPAASSRPSMKVKGSLTAKSLASSAGLTVASGSRVTIAVPSSSRKVCTVSAGKLKALKAGTCRVSVTVVKGKKKSTKTLSVSVS